MYSPIYDILDQKERNLKDISSNDDSSYHNKSVELSLLMRKIKNKPIEDITIKDWRKIKEFSISKGGFLSMRYRKFYYSLILNKLYSEENKDEDNKEFMLKDIDDKFEETIKQDCQRSVFFKLFQDEIKLNDIEEDMIEKFLSEIQKLITMMLYKRHGNAFEYYQGFQELALYMLIIFKNHEKSLENLTKVCNVYFPHLAYRNNKIPFNCILDILTCIIEAIDKNVNRLILDLTKTQPYYALSWILTWFTHNNEDILTQCRIFDYLIMNTPTAVIYLSAVVIIEEFKNLQVKLPREEFEMKHSGIIFKHFQNLQIDKLNWESLFRKSDYYQKKINIETIIKRRIKDSKENHLVQLSNISGNKFLQEIIHSKKNSTHQWFFFSLLILVIIMYISKLKI